VADAYEEFYAMGYAKLHRELLKMISRSRRLMMLFDAGERVNLLPALMAMRDIVAQPGRREIDPSKPNWDDECRILGITPEVVRQWKRRTAAEADIRKLIGEKPAKPGAKDVSTAQALKHLRSLVEAVVEGDDVTAEKIALACVEIYGFGS